MMTGRCVNNFEKIILIRRFYKGDVIFGAPRAKSGSYPEGGVLVDKASAPSVPDWGLSFGQSVVSRTALSNEYN